MIFWIVIQNLCHFLGLDFFHILDSPTLTYNTQDRGIAYRSHEYVRLSYDFSY